MMDFEEGCKLVAEEYRRFEAALPGLLETLRGRWVVFRNDAVQGDFDTEDAAYGAGVQKFGIDGCFVIAEVKELPTEPELLTASIAFGFIG